MSYRVLSCVIALAACSPELPSLPTADEDAPSQIQWVAFEAVEGAQAIAPEAFPAGEVARILKPNYAPAGPAWLGCLALRKANTRRRRGDRGQRRPTRRRVFRPSSRRLHINLSGVVERDHFGTHVGVPQGSTGRDAVVREL